MEIPFNILEYQFGITMGQISLFGLNIILMLFAGIIVNKFNYKNENGTTKTWTFRFFNLSFIMLQLSDILLAGLNSNYNKELSKTSLSLIVVYVCYWLILICGHFIDKKFGSIKRIDDKEVAVVSYSSRMVNLLFLTATSFFALVTIINIWGFNSLLEATGMVGLFLGFLALSSSIWGPDLFHGLILLNSKTIEDGYIIELNDEYYIIHRTSFMETSLLDIANNCRTRMRNSSLANLKIDNITKLAHSHGLRQSLSYKIGYPVDLNQNEEVRSSQLSLHKEKLNKMFSEAFEQCKSDEAIVINENIAFETFLVNTGDFALHYSVSFYINNVKKTKITHQARGILKQKHLVNEKIYEQSVIVGVDLSTPIIHGAV